MSATTAGVAVAVSASTRSAASSRAALGELEVVGPEVVAPLGDAVRLVDGEQRDPRARELGEEALVVEALRRDVEELQRRRRGAGRRSRAARRRRGSSRAARRRSRFAAGSRSDPSSARSAARRRSSSRRAAAPAAGSRGSCPPPVGKTASADLPARSASTTSLLSGAEGVEAEPRGEHLERTLCRCGDVRHAGRLTRRPASLTPQTPRETGGMCDRPREAGADRRLAPAHRHRVAGARDRGVHQLPCQDAGARVGEEHGGGVDL